MALTAKQKRDARDEALRAEGAAEALKKLNPDGLSPTELLNRASTIRPDAVQDAHGSIATPQIAGAKVTVACKLGVPYFDIQLCKIEDKFEQNMQGGRMVKEASRIGSVVRLRGTAYPRGTPPKGFPPAPEMADGAALTRGVDKDFMDAWLLQNRLNPVVMNQMVFVAETDDAVRGRAKDLAGMLSGLDPVNPDKDRRIPKSTRGEITDVEKGVTT